MKTEEKANPEKAPDTTHEETLSRYHILRDMKKRTRDQEREMKLLGEKLEEFAEKNPDAFVERDHRNFCSTGLRGSRLTGSKRPLPED